MTLLLETNHDLPLVRVQIALRTGGADDAADKDGLTNFATELMSRGAGGKSRAQLDQAFDALGTTFEVITDLDGTYFEVTVLKAKLDAVLALIADVLLRPDFPALEAEKLKREIRAQLDELRDDDGQLARRFFQRAMWGGHPYGRTILGTLATLEGLTIAEARAWHARAIRPEQLIFGFAGDLSAGEAEAALARHFPALATGAATPGARYPDPPTRRGLRLTIVDKPDRTQSQILLGQPAPQWGTPDFTALQVATCAYGGTFTARLMNEVRSKRGLSYGASARMGQGRSRRSLVQHVFPSLEQTAETLALVLRLHSEWVEQGITADELAFVQGYLANSFAFSVATPEDRLELRFALEQAALPPDYSASFPERVRAVTLAHTREAMARHLTAGDLEVVLVTTADALLPKLEAAGLTKDATVEVVAYDAF